MLSVMTKIFLSFFIFIISLNKFFLKLYFLFFFFFSFIFFFFFIRQFFFIFKVDIIRFYRYLLLCEQRYVYFNSRFIYISLIFFLFFFIFCSTKYWDVCLCLWFLVTFFVYFDNYDYKYFAFYKKWETLTYINISLDRLDELPYGPELLVFWNSIRYVYIFNFFYYFFFKALDPTIALTIFINSFFESVVFVDAFNPFQIFYINIWIKFRLFFGDYFWESKRCYNFKNEPFTSYPPFVFKYQKSAFKRFFLLSNRRLHTRHLYMDWRAKLRLFIFSTKFLRWCNGTAIGKLAQLQRIFKVFEYFFFFNNKSLGIIEGSRYCSVSNDLIFSIYYKGSWARRGLFLGKYSWIFFGFGEPKHFLSGVFRIWRVKWRKRFRRFFRYGRKLTTNKFASRFKHIAHISVRLNYLHNRVNFVPRVWNPLIRRPYSEIVNKYYWNDLLP